jgi:ABC-type antimicrobial peptide transport system permease subunit
MVLGEALVIGIVGSGLGTLMARGLISNMGSIPGMQLPPMSLDPSLMAGMFGFGALIGLLSGLAPAVGAYRANITTMLRQV